MRTIQLELTLEVTLDAECRGGRWHITHLDEVKSGRNINDLQHLTLAEFLLDEKTNEVLDAYLEHEA